MVLPMFTVGRPWSHMVPNCRTAGDGTVFQAMINEPRPYAIDDGISNLVAGGSVVTIGNFDGVHRGHRTILASVRNDAADRGLPALAVTFEPHPVEVFAGRSAETFRLSTSDERERVLRKLGLDAVLTLPFTRAFAQITPKAFVQELLCGNLHTKSVHVGWDFNFGKDRGGNTETLRQVGTNAGLGVTIHDAVLHDGLPVSSTRIRGELRAGAIVAANQLLGAPWTVHAGSQPGAGRGRTIGVPTINTYPKHRLLPPNGVYATVVHLNDGQRRLPAVSNLGTRPTFSDGHETSLESFCLQDDPGDLAPGTPVAISFLARIREERKFDSADALVKQIARDREIAERHHRETPWSH